MKLICLSKSFPVLKDEYLDEIYKRLQEGEIIYSGSLNIVEYLRNKTRKTDLEYRILLKDQIYKIRKGEIISRHYVSMDNSHLLPLLERT